MKPNSFVFLFILCLSCFVFATENFATENIRKKLANRIINIEHVRINKTPIEGLYELIIGAKIAYVSKNGDFLIQGDVIDLRTHKNITQILRQSIISHALKAVLDDDKIIFKADKEKYIVHIFTDINCTVCIKLHQEIHKFNTQGVTIKYLAFPQSLESLKKMQSIWCNKDKKAAFNDYIKNNSYKEEICKNDSVKNQQEFAYSLGINTNDMPSIFLSNGVSLSGFVTSKELLSYLKKFPKQP